MKSNIELDRLLGMDFFTTDTRGIGGRLRTYAEDFEVGELPLQFSEEPLGEYTHFTLEKRNWETLGAIKAVARALGISRKRLGYAGNKDKRAVTRQRVSVRRVEPEKIAEVKIKDIKLYDFLKSRSRLNLGDAMGNSFRIVIREPVLKGEELETELSGTLEQMGNRGVPNYFGYQRFGISRPNTHLVGKELILRNLEGAVMRYLGFPYDTEDEESRDARRYFEETRDYKGALKKYPKKLGYERTMLEALAQNPKDYAGALRRMPTKLRTLLVHAYQAYLFNKLLSKIIEEGTFQTDMELPLLGYRTKLSGKSKEICDIILDDEGISLRNFFIRSMPEVSAPGGIRKAGLDVVPEYEISESTEGPQVLVSFDLPTGSYATLVLRELMKADPKN